VTLTLTTELEAVNVILSAVGESPVVSLDDDAFVDAETARRLLNAELRSTQTRGWTFNTDIDYDLTPDEDGYISFPANTVRYVFEDKDLTRRGNYLYNRADHTYEFTDTETALELVTLLEWDELPEAMRNYCTICAARKFQDQSTADPSLHKFTSTDEFKAKADLDNYEADAAGWNVHTQSTLLLRMKGRR